jgi:DNA-binding protein H-NS
MTSRDLLKLQGAVAAALARKYDQDVNQAEAAVRAKIKADLATMADKWEALAPTAKPDMNGPKVAEKARRRTRTGRGAKVPAKYKDDAGHAWSGRGKQPRWLAERIAGGARIEDFRVAA